MRVNELAHRICISDWRSHSSYHGFTGPDDPLLKMSDPSHLQRHRCFAYFFVIKRTGSGQLLKSFLRSRGASCCIMSRHAHALPFWDSPPFTLVFPPCPGSSLFEIVTLRQDFKSSACTSPAEQLPMRTHSCRCPQRA